VYLKYVIKEKIEMKKSQGELGSCQSLLSAECGAVDFD